MKHQALNAGPEVEKKEHLMSERNRDTLEIAAGHEPDAVKAVLAGCNSFADVKALRILFHGTVEAIEGQLRGGGYDGVFWAAHTPSIAQAYIPRSGIKTWAHKSYDDERDYRLTPCHHDSPSMLWALEKAGATREDMDITWNGLRPASWTIPKGWPTDGDWDDHLESLGYEADDRGVYDLSIRYNADGKEEIMPADWKKPGQLIIALPDSAFSITDPEWSEDAMGYEPHNRVVDFADFAEAGLKSFRMTDQLQSDFHGNVYHEAVGILPAAIPGLKWMAIPCTRHDGEALDFFAASETPEFSAFMKSINPKYRTEAEIAIADTPVEERKYVVMTDSHRPFDKTKLARKGPHASREDGFWTDTSPDDVWIMDRETADDIVRKLGHNNPRVVRAEKALKIIEEQREARLAVQSVMVEAPFMGEEAKPDESPSPH
jgi:hypothetical protein